MAMLGGRLDGPNRQYMRFMTISCKHIPSSFASRTQMEDTPSPLMMAPRMDSVLAGDMSIAGQLPGARVCCFEPNCSSWSQ